MSEWQEGSVLLEDAPQTSQRQQPEWLTGSELISDSLQPSRTELQNAQKRQKALWDLAVAPPNLSSNDERIGGERQRRVEPSGFEHTPYEPYWGTEEPGRPIWTAELKRKYKEQTGKDWSEQEDKDYTKLRNAMQHAYNYTTGGLGTAHAAPPEEQPNVLAVVSQLAAEGRYGKRSFVGQALRAPLQGLATGPEALVQKKLTKQDPDSAAFSRQVDEIIRKSRDGDYSWYDPRGYVIGGLRLGGELAGIVGASAAAGPAGGLAATAATFGAGGYGNTYVNLRDRGVSDAAAEAAAVGTGLIATAAPGVGGKLAGRVAGTAAGRAVGESLGPTIGRYASGVAETSGVMGGISGGTAAIEEGTAALEGKPANWFRVPADTMKGAVQGAVAGAILGLPKLTVAGLRRLAESKSIPSREAFRKITGEPITNVAFREQKWKEAKETVSQAFGDESSPSQGAQVVRPIKPTKSEETQAVNPPKSFGEFSGEGQEVQVETPQAPKSRGTIIGGFQGRGATPEEVYGKDAVAQGRAVPIFGKGDYVAFSERDASHYGKVAPKELEIRNPFVIRTNRDWLSLVEQAEVPHLHSGSEQFYTEAGRVPEMTERLQAYLKARGYDGVVVKMDGDQKRLREAFGHDQAVKFDDATNPTENAQARSAPEQSLAMSDDAIVSTATQAAERWAVGQRRKGRRVDDSVVADAVSKTWEHKRGSPGLTEDEVANYARTVAENATHADYAKKRPGQLSGEVEQVSPEMSPRDQVSQKEVADRTGEALDKLPQAQAELLRDLYGIGGREARTVSQIAKSRGISRQAMSKRIAKAEASFREELGARADSMFGPSSSSIPVSQQPVGETPSTGKVVQQLSDNFGVPVRTGHFRGGNSVAGIYKVTEEVARLKGYGDIATASHEVSHHLDKVGGVLKSVPFTAVSELSSLDYKPNRGDIHEGFAEYMRHRLTMDDAAKVAPKFDEWFNNVWLVGRADVSEAIARSKAAVDQWRNAGSLARVEAQIDMGESRAAKIGRGLRHPVEPILSVKNWIIDNWYNRLAPLLRVSKEMVNAKTSGEVMQKMRGDLNFWAFAKISNMTASAKARSWAKTGTADVAGNKTGPGLRETLAPIASELRDTGTLRQFYAYCYAQHALDVIAQGKNPGILESDARSVVAQLGNRPGWKKAAEGITNWHNALIDYLVDAGGLPKDQADTIKDTYPHYISLARKMDGQFTSGSGGGGSRYANLPSAIKRLKGSGREILPPLESALAYGERIIGIADKVRVGRMLVEASKKYGMLGDLVEKVDPKSAPHSAKLESLESQLKNAGADLSSADMDALLTVFSQDVSGSPKDNIITLYRNGQREAYWVRDDLYKALTAYDKPLKLPAILDQTAGRVARMIRLGTTGVRAGFSLVTNPLRDMQTAMMQTEYQSRNPFSVLSGTVRGFMSEVTGGEVAQLWKRGGGEMSQPLGIDRKFLQEAIGELTAQSPKHKALNWASHPVDSLRSLFSLPESAPRLGEVEAAWRAEGWRPGKKLTFEQYVKGQLAAANVTVDFREGGSLAMWINQLVPFFNASIQGPARMASAIRNHPVATIVSGLLSITLPSLTLWWRQKDDEWYKQLTPMEKYRYWHVRIPNTETILRIPRPFEWGHFFASIPEAMMESAYAKDSKAFGESVGVLLGDLSPNMLPGIAEAPVEIAANRDFFRDAPLVSEGMRRLRPEDQSTPNTSETANGIGKLFGVPPVYVEHLAEGWTGGLATDATKAIESAVGVATHKTKRQIVGGASTIPVAGRLFLSPSHTRVFDDFYSAMEKAEQKYGSVKQQHPRATPPASLSRFRTASKRLSDYRSYAKRVLGSETLTDDEKRKRFLEIDKRMRAIAKRFLHQT